jgi:hypothetical protein
VKIKLNPTQEVRDKLRPGMSSTAVITTATVERADRPLSDSPARVAKDKDAAEADQPANGGAAKKRSRGCVCLRKRRKAKFTR